jgi:hypothetical protein
VANDCPKKQIKMHRVTENSDNKEGDEDEGDASGDEQS